MTDDRIDPLRLDTIAFVVLLLLLPIVSYGAVEGIDTLWMAGLALLVLGALVPLLTELWLREDEDGNGDGEEGSGDTNGNETAAGG